MTWRGVEAVRGVERAGLVTRRVRGRPHFCRLHSGTVTEAEPLRRYERFWTGRLDILDAILREDDTHSDHRRGRMSTMDTTIATGMGTGGAEPADAGAGAAGSSGFCPGRSSPSGPI